MKYYLLDKTSMRMKTFRWIPLDVPTKEAAVATINVYSKFEPVLEYNIRIIGVEESTDKVKEVWGIHFWEDDRVYFSDDLQLLFFYQEYWNYRAKGDVSYKDFER